MKKKNLKLVILTLTVASFLSSNITAFAKPTNVEKSHGNSNQQVNNIDKNVKSYSKKAEKEAGIISHRLDSIEASLNSILKKMDAYLNSTTTSSAIGISDTTSSAIQGDTSSDEGNVGISIQTSLVSTQDIKSNVETQNLSDDFEKEYEEEDGGRYNSFYGKLNAINNRLNTVERQLSRISDSGNPELAKLNSRVASLRDKVKTSMDSLSKLQKQSIGKIKTKSDKKQMEEQKISQDKKIWKIHFSKELKGETINSKNIMIVDSNNNLVDAGISYDKNNKSVMIETKDGFNKGETYFILIGDQVQSSEGEKLVKPVEQKFTVN
ncbi:Ig-like domain-containing protein [Clostridium sp. OS1-26]|uniref:Ig-like domain-containing protein n=1 Tax=Clostridium sp. OS1-26 TaxID=3070681 RepID=UPI0027DFDFB6|nr:Ig-like domain-containing protein [Clostridium sp. OS1-26]WML37286.1 Ig-like domain-containing protein [Clostridium sp. OS1-26]